MLVLAYDTETTGIIRGHDYTDPSNPFLAAIAMILYDTETHRVTSSFNAVVEPAGWVMPSEASEVNGLTTEYLNVLGIPAGAVIPVIISMASKASLRVAHNVEFDNKIIAAALWRQLLEEGEEEENAHAIIKNWMNLPSFCTMHESKDRVGVLDKRGRVKYPKLAEAYEFFFGRKLDRAHSANADAVAVLEIYMALREGKRV